MQGEGKRNTSPVMGVDVHKTVLAYCIVSETRILLEITKLNTKSGVAEVIALCR